MSDNSEAARTHREAEFHDRAFTQDVRASTAKFYSVTALSKGIYLSRILDDCAGKDVLEYGCGPGGFSSDLAVAGALVTGIDVSQNAVDIARQHAADLGYDDRASFHVMNAEELSFPDSSFDLVCGCGILHHLDIDRGLSEVLRVLKPGGRVVFYEPMGHNPVINLYRRLTPSKRSQDEHPLLWRDVAAIGSRFSSARFDFYHMFSLLSVPLRTLPGHSIILRALEGLDQAAFRLPLLRRQAWVVVMELQDPLAS